MGYQAYEGIPDKILDQQRSTSAGENYTMRCSDSLRVEMPFVGKDHTRSNSQGWLRDSGYYFKALHQNHPEMFSKKNAARVQLGEAPIVDQKMIDHNPQWKDFRGQPLVHHHIGGDGEVAAVPKGAHKGFGEIHNHEKTAGITKQCEQFSEKCEKHIQKKPEDRGQVSSQLQPVVEKNHGKDGNQKQDGNNKQTLPSKEKNTASQSEKHTGKETTGSYEKAVSKSVAQGTSPESKNNKVATKNSTGTQPGSSAVERGDAVRNATKDTGNSSMESAEERANAVRKATEGAGNSSGGERHGGKQDASASHGARDTRSAAVVRGTSSDRSKYNGVSSGQSSSGGRSSSSSQGSSGSGGGQSGGQGK